ncbi:MAG TPA: hypothetical protein PKL57_22010 [Candidatus Wallbacteria bacterium]|nr:hypothetical protein [Candidatus Wallbacteria bacterium]
MSFYTDAKKYIGVIAFYFITFLAFCLIQGCSCESKKHEIKMLEPAGVRVDELRKGRMINAFHAYLKEVDNNAIMKKIKKNAGSVIIGMATTEVTVLAPYEDACIEGMKYYSVSKFDDAARCFKRAYHIPTCRLLKRSKLNSCLWIP